MDSEFSLTRPANERIKDKWNVYNVFLFTAQVLLIGANKAITTEHKTTDENLGDKISKHP